MFGFAEQCDTPFLFYSFEFKVLVKYVLTDILQYKWYKVCISLKSFSYSFNITINQNAIEQKKL